MKILEWKQYSTTNILQHISYEDKCYTEKCDQDNNSLEIVTSVVYSVIFLLFGSAVVYESVKGKAHSKQQLDPNCNIQVNIVIRH